MKHHRTAWVGMLLLTVAISNCGSNDPESKKTFGDCSAANIYNYLNKDLQSTDLLTTSTWGGETYWRPTFLDIRLDLQSVLEPQVYNERIWLGSLWCLASRYAFLCGELEAIKTNDQRTQMIKEARSLLEKADDATKLASSEKLKAMKDLFEPVGRTWRDLLVATGRYAGRETTIKNAHTSLGKTLTGLSLALVGLEAWSEAQKIDAIISNAVIWIYLEDEILPAVNSSNMTTQYPSLRRAIFNYIYAADTYRDDQYDIILQNMMFSTAGVLTGLMVGGSIGGIPGAIVGLFIGFTADQINNGAEYIYNYDMASRLFTLARGLPVDGTDETALCRAVALDEAVSLVKYHVMGKGLVQLIARRLGYVVDNAEKKWYAYRDGVYNESESDIQECFRSMLESGEEYDYYQGQWTGTLTQPSGNGHSKEYSYSLNLSLLGTSVSGTSRLQEMNLPYYAVFVINGSVAGGKMKIVETRILEQYTPAGYQWYLKNVELEYSNGVLTGKWNYGSDQGEVVLRR